MAKGRKKLEVSKADLEKIIQELEAANTYSTLGELMLAVQNTDWAKNMSPRPLLAPVVYARVKELGIICQTKASRKGNPNLGKPTGEPKVRVSRAEKNQKYKAVFDSMRKDYPPEYEPLIKKVEAGSLKAAIRAKCLECSNFSKSEVKECNIRECALWTLRGR